MRNKNLNDEILEKIRIEYDLGVKRKELVKKFGCSLTHIERIISNRTFFYQKPKPIHERLYKWSIPEPNTGCWLWFGTLSRQGYGVIGINKKTKLAHRVSYENFKEKIPSGLFACHKCDTPACINPDHIFIGTNADNVRDCFKKGRGRPGNLGKKICIRGHDLTDKNNFYLRKDNRKQCNPCRRFLQRKKETVYE